MIAVVAAKATAPAEVDAEKSAEATVPLKVVQARLVGSDTSSDVFPEMEKAQMKPESRPEATPYSALSPGRRRFILYIVTAADFFGPLAGNVYLLALPTLRTAFHTSATTINATVSVDLADLPFSYEAYLALRLPLAVVEIRHV